MNVEATGRPVVVGVDDSDGALAAVAWGARYAHDTDSPLRLVHAMTTTGTATVVPGPFGVAGVAPYPPVRSGGRLLAAAVDEAARYSRRARISIGTAYDTPSASLVDSSRDARLLVLGSNDRGRWATLFDSVASRVVNSAYCPVVVVRGEIDPAGPVVVASDGTDDCEPALEFAFREAARRDCALFVVRAWQLPMVATGVGLRSAAMTTDAVGEENIVRAARRSLSDTVARLRERFPGVAAHGRLLQGPPESVVADETSGAALAVVGSRGRGPVAGLLLGSTSQALVHTAKCPVAVVRGEPENGAGSR